jgi:hypothetical protein
MSKISGYRMLIVVISLLLTVIAPINASAFHQKINPKSSPQLAYIDQLIQSIKTEVRGQAAESLTVTVDPILKGAGWAKDSTANLDTALKLLHYFGFTSTQPLNAYISWGPGFRNKFTPISCHGNSGGGSCGNGIMFADIKWFTDSWGFTDPSKSQYPDALAKISVAANLPHEIGHVLQESAGEKSGTHPESMNPMWLREGTAEFYKLITYSIQNNIPYSTARMQYLKYWKYCKDIKLQTLTSQGSSSNGCEYTRGLVAVEYLVWKKKSLNSLFAFQLASGSTQAERFQNAFKFSQVKYQIEADKYFLTTTSTIPSN